jgi:hypothetical protein
MVTPSRIKRSLARIAVATTLAAVPVAAAGCGAGTHLAENVVAHKVINHFAKTPAERRLVNKAFCLVSVGQAFHNLTHHHTIYGAASVALAIKNCEAGFAKGSR